MSKLIKLFALLMIASLLIGCSPIIPQSTATLQPVRTEPVEPTSTSIPATNTPMFTVTSLPILAASTSTATPNFIPTQRPTPDLYIFTPMNTPDAAAQFRYRCLITLSNLPNNTRLEGSLILERQAGSASSFNLKTMLETPLFIDHQETYIYAISPDRKWIFYLFSNGSSSSHPYGTGLGTVNGEEKTFPNEPDWRKARWLDNERLQVTHDGQPYNSVIIFNPFNGQESKVILNLPNAYYYQTQQNSRILFSEMDPTLMRVVYLDTLNKGRLIMWDITKNKMLAWLHIPVPNDPTILPTDIEFFDGWSPDGSQYVIPAPISPSTEELFSINRDGQVEQMTHLSHAYKYVQISANRWSPDGRQIAFWLKTAYGEDGSNAVPRLVVFNTVTQELTDFCFEVGPPDKSKSFEPPVWSPDGRQLAVNIYDKEGNDQIVLVDIANGFVIPIIKNVSWVEGWMINNP